MRGGTVHVGVLDVTMRYCPRCHLDTPLPTCPQDGTPTMRAQPESGERIAVGAVIGGRYRVTGELGRGGFGVVLDAVHVTTGHPVALKILTPWAGPDGKEMADRFYREATLTAHLTHSATVRVFDYGQTDDGNFYLAMERLSGETLQQLIDRGPMHADEITEIALEVLRSLAEAHTVGLVHRDLKPANIFLHAVAGGDRIVKVLDFGIAKASDLRLTQTGKAIGTPTHMAPEQAMGKPVDPRTDVYALGVVLYEALTGELPYHADSPMALMLAHIHEPVPHLAHKPGLGVSAVLANVVYRAMAKDAAQRWQSAQEFRQALVEARAAGLRSTPIRLPTPVLADVPPPPSPKPVPVLEFPSAHHHAAHPQDDFRHSEPLRPTTPLPETSLLRHVGAPPMLRVGAWTASDDGQRMLWADDVGQLFAAPLTPGASTPARLAELASTVVGQHTARVTALAAGADARLVVSGDADGWLRAWDVVTGLRVAQWKQDGAVTGLSLALDGKLLVVGSQDGGAALVDVPGFAVRRVLRGHRGAVTAVAVSRRLVATAGDDGVVRTWDPVGGGARLALRGHASPVCALALPDLAQVLASADVDGGLTLWQPRTADVLWQVQAHVVAVTAVALDRSGQFVATSAHDGTTRVWRWGTQEQVAELRVADAGALSVRFVGDALAVLVASEAGEIHRLAW